jgi:hypothetical protein
MILISSKNFTHKYCLWLLMSFLCFLIVNFYYNLLNTSLFDSNIIHNYTSKYPYIALIVDDRATQQVINAVTNVLQHIPIDWKVQMAIPVQHWSFYNKSSLSPFMNNGRVFMTPLDFPRIDFTSSEFINLILTSPSFWHQVQGEKVLYFQIDSVLCSNSTYKLTDFLEYDYIGAPWHKGGCCNGGISLRSRTKMLQLFENDHTRFRLYITNEDVWLHRHLSRINGRIAPTDIAKTFSVESIYYPRPFAVHKPDFEVLGPDNMKDLCNNCPEVKTITSHC